MPAEARFRVMGSDAHVLVRGNAALLAGARRRLEDLEQKWSRFLPTSEVSRLNARAGRWVPVSADTVLLVQRAVEGWRATTGWFDPMLLGAVLAAGYDRSFDQIPLWSSTSPVLSDDGERQRSVPTSIDIDPAGLVRLSTGAGFDPGGLGKGLAADVVVAEMMAAGASGACVNVGGDLRVTGEAPGGGGWRVSVEDPVGTADGTPLTRVVLADGAVASSSRLRRRWRVGGRERHHLIDPATGMPANGEVVAVTVVAAQAWQAEVLAKAAFLGGDEGRELVERRGAAAMLVLTGGRTQTTGDWANWTMEVAA